MRVFNIFAISVALMTSLPSLAVTNQQGFTNSNNHIVASTQSLYVATTGEVNITFLSSDASYNSDLYLVGNNNVLFNNKTSSPLQTLTGFFEAGTELVFKLYVNSTGNSFSNGAILRNPDNIVHAGYQSLVSNSVIVGFEDMFGGGDRDYNDFVFLLNNVRVGPLSPVPEPSAYVMLIAGLALVGAKSKRKSKK